MKTTIIALIITAFTMSACSSTKFAAGTSSDDIYYRPSAQDGTSGKKDISPTENKATTSESNTVSDYEKYRVVKEK